MYLRIPLTGLAGFRRENVGGPPHYLPVDAEVGVTQNVAKAMICGQGTVSCTHWHSPAEAPTHSRSWL